MAVYSAIMSSANTLGQLQKKMDGISNNMANSNTNGYKTRETTFSDLLHQQVNNQPVPQNNIGRLTPPGLRVGTGAAIAQTALRLEQGPLQETGRELDFALTEKDYFFQVDSGETEPHYSRDGAFYLTEDPGRPGTWTLVNNQGDYLLGENGERMTIPAGARDFTLQQDGTLTALQPNGNPVAVGRVEIVRITKPQLLEAAGHTFRLPDLAALDLTEADVLEIVEEPNGELIQGSLEQSNVDMSKEMVDLMNTQRHYSFNARAISQGDQMMGLINNVRS
ncbi:flagellar hook-basal body protein [Bacillus piscicola]|uniref:flagellar hook-basal body protein n=1 Tax=Bacillus piscicola TaxID=1632684 RepID=UPI001F095D19|nr:flagellar hook-basal body protein [Bacillus piscicola]